VTRTVVHFIDTIEFGGAERALLHLLRGLDRRRWRPVLLHHEEPGLRELLAGVDAAGIERRPVGRMRGIRGILGVRACARAISAESPAVFHAHLNWPLACSGGILAAALNRVPAVVATVQLFSALPRALTLPVQRQLVTRAVGRYIAVCHAVARDLERRLHVPPSRVSVVPNGAELQELDTPGATDPALRVALAGSADVPLVLTLARLDRQKGLKDLLRAAAQLPGVAFVVAGEGPERSALEADARALGVERRVSFIGFRRDVPALLASADLFVLPSMTEGLPLSVLEAMAARRPVIATDVGGTGDVVRHEQTGLLVGAGDATALAAAIRRLLSDAPLAERLARAGQILVRDHYSAADTARRVMAVYDGLLERSRRS
jgi:glycosyltransferase involved in cell wall biosynthesis